MSDANKKDISKKYRFSIAIDLGIMFVFCLLSGVFAVSQIEGEVSFIIPVQFLVISLYYLFGDTIFKNQSVGMKIMNIEVREMSSLKYPSIRILAKRRLLMLLRKTSLVYRSSESDMNRLTDSIILIKDHKSGPGLY